MDYNTEDYYVVNNGLGRWIITQLEFDRGHWWTVESLQYKITSVEHFKFKDFYRNRIALNNLDYKGTIIKALPPYYLGVIWDSGKQVKDIGLANYWVDNRDTNFNKIIQNEY